MGKSKGGCGSVGTHGGLFVAALVLLNGSLSTAQAVLGGDAEPQKQITRKLGIGGGYRPWEDSVEDGEDLVPAWEGPVEWETREGIEIVESGCPTPKFEKACGIDVKIRCSSSEECGAGRLCCPSLHTELNNECSYCTQPVECSCNKVEDFIVCGTNGKSYQNHCSLECAGTEWACNGMCPCKENEIKLGSCPTPNGWRKETSCSNNLPCLNDKGCDLDQKCCPDYNGHMDLSCRSTCQDPKFPVQLSCSRTKPLWLGFVQGLVTAIRLWIFHAIFPERYWFIAHAIFDALEMIFMGVDFIAQGSGFLNGIMGVNSMLEVVGLVWILYYFISAVIRREKVNRQISEQLDGEEGEENEEEVNRAGGEIALDGLCSIIYFCRFLVVLTSVLIFLIGAVPFLFPAIGLFLLAVAMAGILKYMHQSAMRSVPGNPKYPPFSGKAVWTFWIPFAFFFALLILSLQGLEVLGIAGWKRIQLTPSQWYMNVIPDDCSAKKFFKNGCKNRFSPLIKPKHWRKHLEYLIDCGTIKTWIRNGLDYVILIFGIL